MGEKDLAILRRPPLNIKLNAPEYYARVLSNLFETPFSVRGINFHCVEAALQGIKFEEAERQEAVFKMDGKAALQAGREVTNSIIEGVPSFVHWEGEKILYNSVEHRLLLAYFIAEKIRQSPEAQEALLRTENSFIYHDPSVQGVPSTHPFLSSRKENPKTSLPERFYIEVLLGQRYLLKVCERIAPEYTLEEKTDTIQGIAESVRKNPNLQQEILETEENSLRSLAYRIRGGVDRLLPEEFFIAVLRVQRRLIEKLTKVTNK